MMFNEKTFIKMNDDLRVIFFLCVTMYYTKNGGIEHDEALSLKWRCGAQELKQPAQGGESYC